MSKPEQGTLVDVERSPVGQEAARYAEMQDDVEAKKALLLKQGEKVLEAMEKIGQKVFSFTDEYGMKHTFTVVEGLIKLRHAKRQEA